jgi:hypothetical protein
MDEFDVGRNELTGSTITLEFGLAGRIGRLWAIDPLKPETHEEFQFVAPPVALGEELAEDYYPGTVLLGVRTGPDEPWMLGRNSYADPIPDDEGAVAFEYGFGFIDEIRATGRFYEIHEPMSQIVWELRLDNRSRQSVEIGELAFPLALNNVYEGFGDSDKGRHDMQHNRVAVHKFIGGAASHVFAERLTGEGPGLLIFPGDDTRWEFYAHVPASLQTPFHWEGIPVVYVLSKAAAEREDWSGWFMGHTSLVLEPGDSRTYQTRFVSASRGPDDEVSRVLASCGRPAMRIFPAAVAPVDVGIGVEVAGSTPTRFATDEPSELETDSDPEGGYCFVRPETPGMMRLAFEDTQGRESEAHLLFTEPIETLIRNRARWITEHQVHDDPAGNLHRAIVPADNRDGSRITDPEMFAHPFGIECSLADALFLAEKNTIYPDRAEIRVLDEYLEAFVEDDLRNPSDGAVGACLADTRAVAVYYGHRMAHLLVALLYGSMARIGDAYGEGRARPEEHLQKAWRTIVAMARGANSPGGSGYGLERHLRQIGADLRDQDMLREAEEVLSIASRWDAAGDGRLRTNYAGRPLSPSWWWYGSEARRTSLPASLVEDAGEMCLSPDSPAESLQFLQAMDGEDVPVSETAMRGAFGGLLGVWALVRSDGAAGMGFVPDAASRSFGMSTISGDVGIGLYHYLRGMGAYVIPSTSAGVVTFGCHLEGDASGDRETFTLTPWDGVGRKVVVRHVGLQVRCSGGSIRRIRFDPRKRWLEVSVRSDFDKDHLAHLVVRGMWGNRFEVAGADLQALDGQLHVRAPLRARSEAQIEIKVSG